MIIVSLCLTAVAAGADEPPLPEGLGSGNGEDEPALPEGLGDSDGDGEAEPTLPEGLGGEDEGRDDQGPALPEGLGEEPENGPATRPAEKPAPTWLDLTRTLNDFGITGFWEVRGGVRATNDPYQKRTSMGETRFQLDFEKPFENLTLKLKTDFVYDAVVEPHSANLQTGPSWLDLREANVAFTPLKFMDVKVGRQILTWGTGDLIFLNDLFPKDWRSFFIGRDVEYLKAPSDALKTSIYTDWINLDAVYTPQFDPDRFIEGRRLSYYNSTLGRRAGRDAEVDAEIPEGWFDDDEYAMRAWKRVAGYELAAYGYWGFWKSPGGQNPATGDAIFPRLNVYGASVRGPLAGGIANAEVAWYDSAQDRGGDDPFINNSQFRLLTGYERDLSDLSHNLTLGLQYYMEWMAEYDEYLRNLPAGSNAADERRHVVTMRLTKLMMNQNLELSLFGFYSPSDSDAYLRPRASYKIDDHWTVDIGGNVFFGKYDHTFFNQFHENTNIYSALRCSF